MIRRRSPAQQPLRFLFHRRGYTLIEMLIALGLVVVLMTAVWGLISMYSTLQTAGVEATSEQQLVRSVMQLMRDDLATVPLPPPKLVSETSDPFAEFDSVKAERGSDSDSFVEESFSVAFDIEDLWRNENGGPANISIRGTSDVMKITIPNVTTPEQSGDGIGQFNPPSGDAVGIGRPLPEGVAPTVDEFQTIVYQFQRFGSTDNGALPFGLYRIQADAARLQAMLDRRSRPDGAMARDGLRLDRNIIEELLFPQPDERQDQFDWVEGQVTCDLIPDVVGCRFQYHAGDEWIPNWKAGRRSRLPVAIRISLDVISTGELDELQAVILPEGPPGRLEARLSRTFARTELPASRSSGARTFEELRVVPRQYSSLVLLDSTIEVSAASSFGDSSAGEFGQ